MPFLTCKFIPFHSCKFIKGIYKDLFRLGSVLGNHLRVITIPNGARKRCLRNLRDSQGFSGILRALPSRISLDFTAFSLLDVQ